METLLLKNALRLLGLVVLVGIGGLAIRLARRQVLDRRAPRLDELLVPFEEAYRRGQMDEKEFQRIRRSLEAGLRGQLLTDRKPPALPPDADLEEPVPGD